MPLRNRTFTIVLLARPPGCRAPAVYKIAATWSDGSSRELKNYGLACEGHRDQELADRPAPSRGPEARRGRDGRAGRALSAASGHPRRRAGAAASICRFPGRQGRASPGLARLNGHATLRAVAPAHSNTKPLLSKANMYSLIEQAPRKINKSGRCTLDIPKLWITLCAVEREAPIESDSRSTEASASFITDGLFSVPAPPTRSNTGRRGF